MKAFLTRKRTHEGLAKSEGKPNDTEDVSTEEKLAMLASLSDCHDTAVLLDALLACDGSVERANEILAGRSTEQSPQKKTRLSVPGQQTSLSAFNIGSSQSEAKKKLLTKRNKTLHLFDPESIAQHTPCSIIHNFLPKAQADILLHELLGECETYERDEFKMFDRTVVSPHTFAFYINDLNEAEKHKHEYSYNGSYVTTIRATTPEMRKVSDIVQKAVNEEISKRILTHYPNQERLKYQSPKEWTPNTAFVNVYDGAKECVGFHSDQLTHLGPRAIVGSLSLGVQREFRVRKIVPRNTQFDSNDEVARKANDERANVEGQIAIHLPHNSLLVMHAEMQEEWKHSIAPALTIDPHPIAKNKRINITYRCYRDSFSSRNTVKCRCNEPCILRCVQKQEQTRGRYIWQCGVGMSAGREGCNFFEYANFDDDGEPIK